MIYTEPGSWRPWPRPARKCGGKRFQASVLEYKAGGKDISQVLEMPVDTAEAFFSSGEARIPAAHAILARLADVGLGYLNLGQHSTLSGGGSSAAEGGHVPRGQGRGLRARRTHVRAAYGRRRAGC